MMDFKVEQPGGFGVLTVGGNLTIRRAMELREALLESIERVDHLVCDFRNVTEIDVPCIQLFCAAYRTSSNLRKRLTLTGIQSPALRYALKAGGFVLHSGCLMCNGNCLWADSLEKERA